MKIAMKAAIITLYIFILITSTVSVLVLHPIDQSIPEGENVTFTCIFNIRISSEDCLWQLNGVPVHVKSYPNYELIVDGKTGNCSLAIKNVNIIRDEGAWRCFIPRMPDYPTGILSNKAHLVVIVHPSLPNVIYNGNKVLNNSALNITNEKKITIYCETRSGNPRTILYWKIGENTTLNGNTTFENEDETPWLKKTINTLILLIEPNMDSQNITCISSHYDTRGSINFQLNVSYATTSVRIASRILTEAVKGQRLNFVCEANGNPPPHFEWRFKAYSSNKWSAISRSQTLTLLATKSIEGQYLCIAGNNRGAAKWSSEVTLTVSDKVSRLVYNLIIPLVVCFVVALLIIGGFVTYLKWRQRKKMSSSSDDVSVTKTDQYECKNKIDESEINAPTIRKNSGYLKARPLPIITPEDEYIDFDPEPSGDLRGNKKTTKSENREPHNYEDIEDINVYESHHVYENAAYSNNSS